MAKIYRLTIFNQGNIITLKNWAGIVYSMKTKLDFSEDYKLISGDNVDLAELDDNEKRFLSKLWEMKEEREDYFEIYRTAIGPGSPVLHGGSTLLLQYAESELYLVAIDIATRAGIEQDLILDPQYKNKLSEVPKDGSYISVVQASDLIGVSRAAVYKAISSERLKSIQIGNIFLVEKASAIEFRKGRENKRLSKSHGDSMVNQKSESLNAGSGGGGGRFFRIATDKRRDIF